MSLVRMNFSRIFADSPAANPIPTPRSGALTWLPAARLGIFVPMPADLDANDNALLDWIQRQRAELKHPLVLGICGAQGSGKSTLARKLITALTEEGWRCAGLSLDDLYLPHAQRQALASRVHPLLVTRGVPGTHDTVAGARLLRALRLLPSGKSLALPRFDKANDDPHPSRDWPRVEGPLDLIVFEGWCVGVPAQTPAELEAPINALELNEDPDGRWRHWVNERLAEDYSPLFAPLDRLIYLQVPDWDSVLRWRAQQERDNAAHGGAHLMDADALARFCAHYQRLTEHALHSLPARADVLRTLATDHATQSQEIRA